MSPLVRAGLEAALARQVLPHLPPHPFVLASYRAMGAEISPAAVHDACPQARIVYPRVNRSGEPLTFHHVTPDQMVPGPHAIPQPPPSAPVDLPSVLLVPLLAADYSGNRLGQGGGHYDRTLAALRAQSPVTAIGLAWDVQLAPHVAPATWDQPLDAVATPTAFIWCRSRAM